MFLAANMKLKWTWFVINFHLPWTKPDS
jgi:hypothetical protein